MGVCLRDSVKVVLDAIFKNLKGVAGIFGKLKMVAGPLAIGFTALNSILKVTQERCFWAS